MSGTLKNIALALVVIALVVLLGAVPYLPSYPKCKCEYYAENGSQNPPDEYRSIKANFICFIEGVDTHNGIITALATIVIAGFTLALVNSTNGLIGMERRHERNTRLIERAYVKMSHPPESLTIDRPTGTLFMTVGIKNYGRTPARVTDSLITGKILHVTNKLPEPPDYSRTRLDIPVQAFLMPNDEIFYHSDVITIKVENTPKVEKGDEILYIYGYVDYIDIFGIRHRGGYARRFNPALSKNNLIYAGNKQYNYDRERKKGEGNDWD